MKEIIKEIIRIDEGIKEGKISKEEINFTIQRLNDLVEQLIITRYKYFEQPNIENNSVLMDKGANKSEENIEEETIDFSIGDHEINEKEKESMLPINDPIMDSVNESNEMNLAELSEDEKRLFRIIDVVQNNRKIVSNKTFGKLFLLNEKLTFINELFDGSSEAFSKAVKAIDAKSSLKEAIKETAKYSKQYHWDIDCEIVEDFVFKIRCRFA